MFNIAEVNSQSELQETRKNKQKKTHHHDDVSAQQKHAKYQKAKCDNFDSLDMSMQKEHEENSSEEHCPNKELSKQLFSDTLSDVQRNINDQQQENRKKKKKKKRKLIAASSDGCETQYADCKQLCKHKKKKRHNETRYKDAEPRVDFADDCQQHCSALSVASSGTVVSSSETVSRHSSLNTSTDSHIRIADTGLETVSSDEMKYVESVYKLKYVERVYKEHKSKHKKLKLHSSNETEVTDCSPVEVLEASSNVGSEKHDQSHTKKTSSEECSNTADILKLLHAENSPRYLCSKSDVERAGEALPLLCFC